MSGKYPQQSVIVSDQAVASDDPYDIIQSNIDFLNAQFDEYLTHDEVSDNALRSYYVDYFLAQFENGGFSQFVYNSGWGDCIDYLVDGFEAMGAVKHFAAFENAAKQMQERPGVEGLKKFFESDYWDENEERDILNEFDEDFLALQDTENLIELNANWLRQLPDLVVLTEDQMAEEIQRRAAAIPDREARIAEALAAEPRFMKIIRALCEAAGHELDRVTAGDPTCEYNGQQLLAWHFLTDQGHFHMLDVDGKAIMFKGHSDEVLCEIVAGDELGTE